MGRFKDSIYQQHEGGLLDDESGELQDLRQRRRRRPQMPKEFLEEAVRFDHPAGSKGLCNSRR